MLAEKGIEVRQLDVKTVGFAGARFGPGALLLDGQSLNWESIELGYGAARLLEGRIDQLAVDGPSLHLHAPVRTEPAQPQAGTSVPPQFPRKPSIQEGDSPQLPHGESPGTMDRRESVADPVMTGSLQDQSWVARLNSFIDRLPVAEGYFDNGRLLVDWGDRATIDAGWMAEFLKTADDFNGKLTLDTDLFASLFTLTRDFTPSSLSLFGEMEFRAGPLMERLRVLADLFGEAGKLLQGALLEEPIQAEWLVESSGDTGLQGSVRLVAASLGWQPPLAEYPPARIQEVLMLATYRNGELSLKSGGRVSAYAGPSFTTEAFGIQLSGDASTLGLRADPVGLKRKSTLWLEEFSGRFSFAGALDASLTWYNGVGAHMGDVRLKGEQQAGGEWTGALQLARPDKPVFLDASLELSPQGPSFSMRGELPNDWLNALADWWWGKRFTLAGGSPVIQAELARPGLVYKGEILADLDKLELRLPNGALLDGITGNCRLRVNGLPSTDGVQTLRIGSFSSGNLRLTDLDIEWALPTLRNLSVMRASAGMRGGRVSLDPFVCDPFNPAVETVMRLEGIPAQQVLDWIGEERFTLQGSISGEVPLGWEDGILQIGKSALRMDSSTTQNRFRFADREFLEEQFAQMGGIPAELKDPFLATLLADGIRIRDAALAFAPDEEQGKVVLRLRVSGETRSESMEVPIESLIINNVISREDLGHLLGMVGPVEFIANP